MKNSLLPFLKRRRKLAMVFAAFAGNQATAQTYITTNTTWSISQTIPDNLIIQDNATLTITGSGTTATIGATVTVKPGSKLVIKNSAVLKINEKLILENALPTSSLNGAELNASTGARITSKFTKWKGIEVLGELAYAKKAKAIFNDVTIEKAEVGVATYKVSDNTRKGGIIKADLATFKNHGSFVRVRENPLYMADATSGYIITVPTNNPSYFKRCTFLNTSSDNPFPKDPMEASLHQMLALRDVKGISVLGCTFEDQAPTFYCLGVRAENSDYRVAPDMASISWGDFYLIYTILGKFKNLNRAVSHVGSGNLDRAVIQQAKIEGSEVAIALRNTKNSILVNNTITNLRGLGVAIDLYSGSTGFKVENNTLNGADADQSVATYIEHSTGANNEVYGNTFKNFHSAIIAQGINRSIDGASGLRFFCNDMSANSRDTTSSMIVWESMDPYSINGIASLQGTATMVMSPLPMLYPKASGNLFPRKYGFPILDYNELYKSPAIAPFNYLYSTASIYEKPLLTNAPLVIAATNSCPVRSIPPFITSGAYYSSKNAIEGEIATLKQKSALTAIDSQRLNTLYYQQYLLVDSMLMTYLYKDSNVVRYDSIVSVLNGVQHADFTYKVALAGAYASQLRFADAISLLNQLPSLYALTTYQANDVLNMAKMYGVLQVLLQNDDSWDAVSQNLKNEVNQVAADNEGCYGPSVAHYIRSRYMGIEYDPHRPITVTGSRPAPETGQFSETNSIYPVPAGDQLFVTCRLGLNTEATAYLYDMNGKAVQESRIVKGINEMDISRLVPGAYMVTIRAGNQTLYQQKIVKQ